MIKRKICVVTGTRAEYGLLFLLMKAIDSDKELELQIIVTGMHLSSEFGNTYQQIESDGFVIDINLQFGCTNFNILFWFSGNDEKKSSFL